MNFIDINKKFEEWHDIIDVKVPLISSPAILHCPRIPLPLHFINPRSILTEYDKTWWDRTRKKVYEVSGFKCMCCGVEKSKIKGYPKYLDAHEMYYIDYKTGRVELRYIVSLCHTRCHPAIHFGRLTAQHESGKITDKEFMSVLSYANTLLAKNNLPAKNWNAETDDNICNIPWKQWYLALNINGKEERFYSKFTCKEELEEYYREINK